MFSRHTTQSILRNWTNFGAVQEQRGKKVQVLFKDMLLKDGKDSMQGK